LIFNHWKGSGVEKSGLPSAVVTQIDGYIYIKGSSRRRLPGLLRERGQIDLFVHDSRHSERNVRFELDGIWPTLGPKGAVVVDDIDANWGFQSFTQAIPDQQSLICEAEPLRPDPRRFNKKGLFGIILKSPTANCNSRHCDPLELKRDTQHFDFEWPEQLHDPALSKSKSESYACTIQRVALLNSKECDFRLAPASPRCRSGAGGFEPPHARIKSAANASRANSAADEINGLHRWKRH
jgi:hypothetical protein